jgi:hypothetical protein
MRIKKPLFSGLVGLAVISSIVIGYLSLSRYIDGERFRFYCESIQQRMSVEEIKSILDKYGTYTWSRDEILMEWSYIYFDSFLSRITFGSPVVLRFDSNEKLIAAGGRVKLGDEFNIDCSTENPVSP